MELLIGAHDPEGKLADHIKNLEPASALFESTLISLSPSTAITTEERVRDLNLEIIPGSYQPHETKLALLKRSTGSDVFSTELDKLLHMQRFFPDELEAVSRMQPDGFVLLGRTPKAFKTCPHSWQENERVANKTMEDLLGIEGIDICVGDFLANREVINLLKNKSALPGWECLVEMPADVIIAGYPLRYLALKGLEWEDPDRYQEEIREEGFEAWKRRLYDSDQEWNKRRQELDSYLKAIARFRNRLETDLMQSQSNYDSLG